MRFESLFERNCLQKDILTTVCFGKLLLSSLSAWGGLLFVGRLGVGAVVAGAGGGQLEGLDGEGEVLVIGIVDQEPVINIVRNSASKGPSEDS